MEDLRGFNTPDLQVDNSTAKLLAGAMIVTLAVGAGAAYALSTGMWSQPAPQSVALKEPLSFKAPAPVMQTPAPALVPAAPVSPAQVAPAPTHAARVHVIKRDVATPATPEIWPNAPAQPAVAPPSPDATTPATEATPAQDPATTPASPAQPAP